MQMQYTKAKPMKETFFFISLAWLIDAVIYVPQIGTFVYCFVFSEFPIFSFLWIRILSFFLKILKIILSYNFCYVYLILIKKF